MWRSATRQAGEVAAVGLASLAVTVPGGQAQDAGFCSNAKVVGAMSSLGSVGGAKVFDAHPGTWCQYGGTHGSYVENVPHVTAAAFGQAQTSRRGTTSAGLGVPAFSTTGPGTYKAIFALKGSTEIAVGANSTPAKL